MSGLPRISIVTPSFNQGRYLAETLQSLVDQQYPNLEVIIQDGGSTDDAIAIATEFVRHHPTIFQLFVEKDSGQADALNRGFDRTTGDILGFLNSDDTLYPGCLQRVSQEIDPARNRWIVFGRCLFTGEGSRYVGIEHPAEFRSRFEFLAIWKRGYNTMPQPSVFWHRAVWEKCGGLNTREHHALDYDLFCRFARYFHFHRVDELWSTYRMHAVSKSFQRTESEILELSVAVSRQHWGAWWSPLRWRCGISYWLHNRQLLDHARHHARLAEAAGQQGRYFAMVRAALATAVYSPRIARDRLLYSWIGLGKLSVFRRLLLSRGEGFTGQHGDSWIGPVFRTQLCLFKDAQEILFHVKHIPQGHHKTVRCIVKIGGKNCAEAKVSVESAFTLRATLPKPHGDFCIAEIRSDSFFVPRDVHNTPDDRKLSLQLLGTQIR